MHILIVDDEAPVRRVLQRSLERAGYTAERGHRISCAADGDICRAVVANDGPVDVIFMDGYLGPGDTGPLVVFKLREAGCTAKIIMTSSKADMAKAGLTAGADSYCDKVDFGEKTEAILAQLGIPPP
jgi:CheY-like chemotaxis protein